MIERDANPHFMYQNAIKTKRRRRLMVIAGLLVIKAGAFWACSLFWPR